MKASYLTNTDLEKAIANYRKALANQNVNLKPTAQIPLNAADGLYTAEAVYAQRSIPQFLSSAMDGIAVCAESTFGATETTPIKLDQNQFIIVDTGDPIPDKYNAVIMIEDIVWLEDDKKVQIEHAAVPWQHIRQIGEDFCTGDMLVTANTKITAPVSGVLTAAGIENVNIYRPMTIHIIPTGDEVVPASKSLEAGDIPEYNGAMLRSCLSEMGHKPLICQIVPDKPDLLKKALQKSLKQADMVIIIAGSSAGRDDYTSQIISSIGQVLIHGIAIKPGKPAILGICENKPVIGMPGYPVSAYIVFDKVLKSFLEFNSSVSYNKNNLISAKLTRSLTSSLKYKEYIRVRLNYLDEQWLATPMERGAGLLSKFIKADGLLTVDQNCEGINAGSKVEIELFDNNLQEIKESINLIGSHDPLLDELADIMQMINGRRITSTHTGSLGGLIALKRGEALLAPVHLLDPVSGIYNIAEIRRLFPDGSVVLIEGFKRTQGLLLPKGNTKKISSITDIAGTSIRYVNRQPGSGTRILLDYLLEQKNISHDQINGYNREELTHTGVAAQIKAGTADTGIGILSVAKIFDLDFIPLAQENYDFAVRKDQLNNKLVKDFIAVLSGEIIKNRLATIGGYDFDQPGRIKAEADDEG